MFMQSSFLKAMTCGLLVLVLNFVVSSASAKTPAPKAKPSAAPVSSSQSYSSGHSYGSDETYEVQSLLSRGSFVTSKQGDSTVSVMEAGASLAKMVYENIQAGGEVHFYNTSGGAKSSSYFEAAGFGTYNFGTVLRESFYAKAGLGLFNTINDKGDNESKFGFFAGGGRRFPIHGIINYAPEARVAKIGSLDPSFSVYFINFSVLF